MRGCSACSPAKGSALGLAFLGPSVVFLVEAGPLMQELQALRAALAGGDLVGLAGGEAGF